MIKNTLKKLNFKENEIKVYLSLFELGQVRAGEIIKKVNLHRNLVYQALEKLENRNLITKVTIKGVAEFSANSPASLLDEIENQKQLAQKAIKELKTFNQEKNREIKIYEGLDGIKQARNKILDQPEGTDFFVMGASKLTQTPELEPFWRSFHKKREQKGIKQKMLFENTSSQEDLNILKWRNNLPNMETRFLPFTTDSPFWFDFAGDELNFGLAGQKPLTINIKSPEIVKGLKKYFNYFWNQKVFTTNGRDELKKGMRNILEELKPGEEYKVLGTTGKEINFDQDLNEFYDQFHEDRVKKGIKVKMLSYSESYNNIKKRFEKVDPNWKITQLKIYSQASETPMQICLYKEKVLIILYEKNPTVILLNKPEIYQAFNDQFEKTWNQDTYIMKGLDSIGYIFDQMLNYDEACLIGAKGYFLDRNPKFIKEWAKKAQEKKNFIFKNIVDPSVQGHPITKLPFSQTKYTLKKEFSDLSVFWIFGGKVAISNWTEKEPIIVLIENQHIYDLYKKQFNLLWQE